MINGRLKPKEADRKSEVLCGWRDRSGDNSRFSTAGGGGEPSPPGSESSRGFPSSQAETLLPPREVGARVEGLSTWYL